MSNTATNQSQMQPEREDVICATAPLGLLAELTHRCPLQCPYCSNPIQLQRSNAELPTETWLDVIGQAAEMGILQIHLSGGEPTLRRDLETIVAKTANVGIYSNLITAGVLLSRERIAALAENGLDHVQLSLQDVDPVNANRIAAYKSGHQSKLELAGWVRELGLPLTINAPVHRQNIMHLDRMIELAADLGAGRIEVAHIQYYGWAYVNRAALMPTIDQVKASIDIVAAARERLKGVLTIDFVVPDYYARRPKPCMGGWGSGVMCVSPAGKVLPCHAADSIPGLQFDNVKERSLLEIWLNGEAFEAFRGTAWMKEPCRSCELRDTDFGGCRCQAFALTGDAANADPACDKSDWHAQMVRMAQIESTTAPPEFIYRRIGKDPAQV
ncbi:MAG: pyrroloquinoline quinone biosynthesis protein PqqE [Hyphomicrobiaceae bacterium]